MCQIELQGWREQQKHAFCYFCDILRVKELRLDALCGLFSAFCAGKFVVMGLFVGLLTFMIV